MIFFVGLIFGFFHIEKNRVLHALDLVAGVCPNAPNGWSGWLNSAPAGAGGDFEMMDNDVHDAVFYTRVQTSVQNLTP